MQGKTYLFAGIPVELLNPNPYIIRKCRMFETDDLPEIHIEITKAMREAEQSNEYDLHLTDQQFEFLAFHRAFGNQAAVRNVMIFHSSALMIDGKAYLFAAPSGTGKSTHAALWREFLGDRVTMINDDKPFLKEQGGEFVICGSPWMGVYDLGNNISAPLAGVCFLNQGKESSIRQLSEQEKLPLLLQQTFRPESLEGIENMLRMLVEMSERIPMWHLDCNISHEAAELSYNTMRSVT